MSFLKKGSEGRKFYQEEKERRASEAQQGENVKNWRFRLKKNSTGYIVFIDDLDTFVLEHQYQKNGNYYNYATCIKDIEGECPLCDSENRAALVAVTTVIDFTEHKKKDGSYTQPTKKLMVVKQGGTERLLKRQDKYGSLKFRKFEVTRSGDAKGEATGTDLDFEKEVDLEKLKQFVPEGVNPDEWVQPFDYDEIFKPKSASELRSEIGLSEPVGGAESTPNPDKEPDKEPARSSLKDMI